MFRSVRKKSRPATLTIDALEERCTPAALLTPIQPPIVVTLAPVQAGHAAPVLVRTDLFGGCYDQSASSEDNDPLAIQEPFTSQEPAFELMPLRYSDVEPGVRPAEVQQAADDAPTQTVEAEPIALCVVVEYD